MHISMYILSCPEREQIRNQTVASLQATDWNRAPILEIDCTSHSRRQERQEETSLKLLQRAIADAPDFFLFLEDDLDFNRYLRHNLENWLPLKRSTPEAHFFASLYNPTIRELERHEAQSFFVAHPQCVYGSQAFLMSRAMGSYIVEHWSEVIGMQDIRMSRLAACKSSIYYHVPSLVQHVGRVSVWGGHYHWTNDFQKDWKA